LLIVFGVLAIGSPFLAAVAVSVVIAWLIMLAGIVHLILAFHVHRAGSLIYSSEILAEPPNHVRACGGSAATRICVAGNQRTEDG
jgi:hypothetical protein